MMWKERLKIVGWSALGTLICLALSWSTYHEVLVRKQFRQMQQNQNSIIQILQQNGLTSIQRAAQQYGE